ncbi:unnamed protein product, partial [Strongylus vulgaris]
VQCKENQRPWCDNKLRDKSRTVHTNNQRLENQAMELCFLAIMFFTLGNVGVVKLGGAWLNIDGRRLTSRFRRSFLLDRWNISSFFEGKREDEWLDILQMLLLLTLLSQVYMVASLSEVYSYQSPRRCANDTEIIDHLLLDTALHYNKHKLPSNPVDVRIEMWVQEVTSVSELTQDFEIGK